MRLSARAGDAANRVEQRTRARRMGLTLAARGTAVANRAVKAVLTPARARQDGARART
jgi:hypothetical protein